MIVIFMVMHVVLELRFAIDHPKISQIGSPQTKMANLGVGIGFLDGIFHFNHGVPPFLFVKAFQIVAIVQTFPAAQS
jgi:hypothetical protein